MTERLKTALKVNAEEWTILEPLIEKVYLKQREAMGGRMSFSGRRSSQSGDQGNRPSPGTDRGASPESDALRTALESEGTSAAEIKNKLEALRAARKKATAELETAREELRKVLTQRQEATLVLMGLLQ